jgi:hypothetical protein
VAPCGAARAQQASQAIVEATSANCQQVRIRCPHPFAVGGAYAARAEACMPGTPVPSRPGPRAAAVE